MLDVEFFQSSRQYKQIVTYTLNSLLFRRRVVEQVTSHYTAKGIDVVQLRQDNPIAHLNEPSLFGEKFYILDLLECPEKDKQKWVSIFTLLVEKTLTSKILILFHTSQAFFNENPQVIALKKMATSIEGIEKVTKASLIKTVAWFYLSQKKEKPTNYDIMEQSLVRLIAQDDYEIDELWRKLDLIDTICISENSFDAIPFNKYIFQVKDSQVAYRWHELIYSVLVGQSRPQIENSLTKIMLELDILINTQGREPRQIIGLILSALKDLLAINAQIGGATEKSELSNFKRQKLAGYASIEPFKILRLYNLLVTEENIYRNSKNILVDFESNLFQRYLSGVK